MGVWQICLLAIILDAASAIFHLFEAFFDLWIGFYVCVSKYLIFNFVGSELAETDGGVADLPALDNIRCCECNILSF